MGFFSAWRKAGDQRARKSDTVAHMTDFVATRKGVEAYFELEGPRDPASLILVARDGEWTRRPVPNAREGAKLATQLGIPFYEVIRTGYPQRMRDWSAKNR